METSKMGHLCVTFMPNRSIIRRIVPKNRIGKLDQTKNKIS